MTITGNISKKVWIEKDNKLYKRFEFKDFNEAFSFMTSVALIAEKLDHHPEWRNIYNVVELSLCTHSAGNKITKKDHELANRIDQICKFSSSV